MKGFAYPFEIGDDGPKTAEGAELVAGALTQLAAQEKGERPFQPSNGRNLWKFVFADVETLVAGDARRELTMATRRNEPRADVIRVDARADRRDNGAWEVNLTLVWQYDGEVYAASRPVSPPHETAV